MGTFIAVGIGFVFVLYYSNKARRKIQDWEKNKNEPDENKKEP